MSQAAYLRVPQTAKASLAGAGLPWREGLHAAMHAILNVVPLHMMCGIGDLGAECDNPYSARFRPDRLLLFDKHPGGIGLAFKVKKLIAASCNLLSARRRLPHMSDAKSTSKHESVNVSAGL